MQTEHHRVVVVLDHRLFPALAPARSPGGSRVILDGATIRIHRADKGAANESEPAVVEVITGEIVDQGAGGARCHERVNDHVFIEK